MASSNPPTPPFTIGGLEGALVAFLGAFATTEAAQLSLGASSVTGVIVSLVAGLGAFASFLGYYNYNSS
jgi:hypothetical protein